MIYFKAVNINLNMIDFHRFYFTVEKKNYDCLLNKFYILPLPTQV